ncbi:MAG: TlpA disulfide reductase family protein [Phycisphaerae bacterium]|nr:TlpA disulfide reductase family protein [Phycisphaerae bacterium]
MLPPAVLVAAFAAVNLPALPAESVAARGTPCVQSQVSAIAIEAETLAPDFALKDTDGKTVELSDLRGKVVVIEFWATWCAPCMSAIPTIASVVKDAGSDVVFLAINVDDNESAKHIQSFLRAKKLDVRALVRGKETSKKYDVGPIPHSVVIGRDGKIVGKHVGFNNERAFKAKLSGEIRDALRRRKSRM